MARFCSLSSSSKGNCYYFSGAGTSLLVDAGISCKQINLQLKKQNIDLSEIEGILITHEHSDHVRGLDVLTKNFDIPIYSSEETLCYLSARGMVPAKARLIAVEGEFTIGNININPFDTPHDAVHSFGYRLELPDENKVAIATDLGSITTTVRENLEGCELVVIESNFDHGMLDCSSYPYVLKRRIRSEHGHLANEDCAEEIAHLLRTGTTRFVLGHLSEQNNIPALAYATTKSVLEELDMIEGKDYLLQVAPAKEAGSMVVI